MLEKLICIRAVRQDGIAEEGPSDLRGQDASKYVGPSVRIVMNRDIIISQENRLL